MSELKSSLQPYMIRHQGALSALHLQSLLQLYQPIIGSDAVNFYLLLMQEPVNEQHISQKKVHSYLFPFLGEDLKKLDDARLHLEAVGLIKTFKETKEKNPYPTLLYDLQYPFLMKEFCENSLLINSLINAISETTFFEILRQWEIAEINIVDFEEVSVTFDTIFQTPNNHFAEGVGDILRSSQIANHQHQIPKLSHLEVIDYNQFLVQLIDAQIDQRFLNAQLKREVFAWINIYGISTEQLVDLIKKEYRKDNRSIDFEQLRIEVKKLFESQLPKAHSFDKQLDRENSNGKIGDNHKPLNESARESLSDTELALLQLCEQYTPYQMLTGIKVQERQGFITDEERLALTKLLEKTTLPDSVISFLIWYQLAHQNKMNLNKFELDRVANIWQQHKIRTVEQAIAYVKSEKNKIALTHQASYMSNQKKKKEAHQPFWTKKPMSPSDNDKGVDSEKKMKTDEIQLRAIREKFEKLSRKESES